MPSTVLNSIILPKSHNKNAREVLLYLFAVEKCKFGDVKELAQGDKTSKYYVS